MAGPLAVDRQGGTLQLRLARPKANVVDADMIRALSVAIHEHGRDPHLKAIVLGAEGPHFSFGASVEEHRPESCAAMLRTLHALFRDILDLSVPMVSAVRGQCLGGALELVLCGSFVLAAPDAKLGQPEIKLGVFAPMASAILPFKLGMAHAERLLLTGESIDAARAHAIGLVDAVVDDPDAAAHKLVDEHFAPKSAASLRHALRAVRAGSRAQLDAALSRVEAMYLDELMATHDAKEGIASFIEKRSPRWEDR